MKGLGIMSSNIYAALGEDGAMPAAKPATHKEVTGGAKEKQYGAKGMQGDKKKHTSAKHDRTHGGKSSEHKGGAGKGNWGKAGDELDAAADNGDESATEAEMETPSNEMSLEEAMKIKEEKKKAVAALAKTGPARAVDTSAFAAELKPNTPMGQLPILEVDGKKVCQSGALLRYAGKLAGLYPEDAWKALKVDEFLGAWDEASNEMSKQYGLPEDQREEFRRN